MEESAIRKALDSVLGSEAFKRSERCSAFLRYVVEEHLAGRSKNLQGTTIAQDVFGRDADFDSNTDPIVRVQAGRCRGLLGAYYGGPGANDPIRISIPKGGYAPAFESQTEAPASAAIETASEELSSNYFGFSRTQFFGLVGALFVIFIATILLTRSQTEPALVVPSGPKILVTQYSFMGDDGLAEVVTRGFQIEVIGQLSRFKDLFVFGPDAASPTNPALIGGAIQPDFVLSGTIELRDGQFNVTNQLLDAASANVVWSDKIETTMASPDELMEVKSTIVSEVAASLGQPYGVIQGYLSRQANTDLGEGSLDDYLCMLRFYGYTRRKSEEEHAFVRDCLEKATAASPNYSSGWAALSWIYGDEERENYNRRNDAAHPFERSINSARKAVEADPYNDLAHEYLGAALLMQGNEAGFLRAFETALSLNPNNTESLAGFGYRLILINQDQRGKAMVEKAIQLNPGHPPWFHQGLIVHNYKMGDYEEAYRHANAFVEDNSALSKMWLTITSMRTGDNAKAIECWFDLLRTYPDKAEDMEAYLEMRQYPDYLIDMVGSDLEIAKQLAAESVP